MSMEHHAFSLNYRAFETALLPVLNRALESSDLKALMAFVDANLDHLRTPYDGGGLGPGWREELEVGDVQEVGDFALTRFYDPTEDIGLGSQWIAVAEAVKKVADPYSLLLGTPVGPAGRLFDPGRLGSYFQTEGDVTNGLEVLNRSNVRALDAARKMFEKASAQGCGLYVTF